jgi:hypothetical protein
MDVLKAVPEKYRTSVEKTVRPIAIAALGMATTLGCKASELTAAMPDALYGAGSGFVGTMLIELELGEGRLVSYAMTKTKSCGLGLLSMGVFLAPPIVVSASPPNIRVSDMPPLRSACCRIHASRFAPLIAAPHHIVPCDCRRVIMES